MAKTALGKLQPAAIGMMELPRLEANILEGFRALDDLTGTTGVCFVPFARAAQVLAVAERLAASEAMRLKALADGISLAEFLKLPR